MGGYIAHFSVYTMAMIGLICFAVFVYKKLTDGSIHSNSTKVLNIEESMSLSPRKTLHVVRAGNERFLIASDVDRTTLISKLDWNKAPEVKIPKRFEENARQESVLSAIYPIQSEAREKKQEPQVVHLDIINPERKRIQRRAVQNSSRKIQNSAGRTSTMKAMAQRINEL